jgi:cytochrome c oxidase cbb3-type subunit 4
METLQAIYAWARPLWVVWLMLIFVGIVAWAYWPGRKKSMEDHGRIPFRDDEPPGGGRRE